MAWLYSKRKWSRSGARYGGSFSRLFLLVILNMLVRLLLVLFVVLGGPLPRARAGIAPLGSTGLAVVSERGNTLYGGVTETFEIANASFSVTSSEEFALRVSDPLRGNILWEIRLAMPANGPLRAGTYTDVAPIPSGPNADPETDIERVRFSAWREGRRPEQAVTTVTVNRAAYLNDVFVIDATAELRAAPGEPAVRLAFRYNAELNGTSINQRPGVYAGRDRVAFLNHPFTLSALAFDDGLPVGAALRYRWKVVNQAGPVAFSNFRAATPVVQCASRGTYIFEVEVTDVESNNPETIAKDSLMVSVVDPGGQWQGFAEVPNGDEEPATGWLKVAGSKAGELTGSLRVWGSRVSFKGSFDEAGRATVPVKIGTSDGILTAEYLGDGSLLVSLKVGEKSSTAGALLSSTRDSSTPAKTGSFALALTEDRLDGEIGYLTAYGRLTLRRNGAVSMAVTLPGGTRVNGASVLNTNNELRIVLAAPQTRTWLGVELSLEESEDGRPWIGYARWIRPVTVAKVKTARESEFFIWGTAQVAVSLAREPLRGVRASTRATLSIDFGRQAGFQLGMTTLPGGIVTGVRPFQIRRFFGPGGIIYTQIVEEGGGGTGTLTFSPGGGFSGWALTPGPRLIRFSGILVRDNVGPGSYGIGYARSNNGELGRVTVDRW